jgi:hypothetical protein
MLSEHPTAMLDPGLTRSSCIGGIGAPPSVSVRGTHRGDRVGFDARVMCDWPGGEGALAYWAAAVEPHYLPLASVRIHCDDDAALLSNPIRWSRVRACLRALPRGWHS